MNHMALNLKHPPRKVLMIKSHSVGIGDVLRSSAAWRAMKNAWPGVELHLLFLTKHAGYPSEAFIQHHHLLASSTFLPIRTGTPHDADARKIPNWQIIQQVRKLAKAIGPDWVIDFEWAGSRTSVLTWLAAHACKAQSLGIAEFPLRGLFYDHLAPSKRDFVHQHALTEPFDYTLRDFVVLKGVGIERNGLPIELQATEQAHAWVKRILPVRTPSWLRVGLNIGCATQGAAHKRMSLDALAAHFKAWQQEQSIELILTGAHDEAGINAEFIRKLKEIDAVPRMLCDLAGQTQPDTLTALINEMDVFISTDSGPYHMAVGLKKPTLCWFTAPGPGSLHCHPWVIDLVQPSENEFLNAMRRLQSVAQSI
jgi:ADP-heptose:LPS heptosyltransferase